jgi:NAD(P)-dependent dehydrogenase (short-subunit alcohol dehydrogenase family)
MKSACSTRTARRTSGSPRDNLRYQAAAHLRRRVALITGASRGIGLAAAHALLARNINVCLTWHRHAVGSAAAGEPVCCEDDAHSDNLPVRGRDQVMA